MDFVMGLSRTQSGYDALWIIVDRLTKVAHFRHVKMTYTRPQLVELYMPRIVCFHAVPIRIVSDGETQVISKFWDGLPKTMDIRPSFSSTYHPQTDGQTERVNQILEDMLRGCALQYGRS
jgi:hypothetical protein